MVHSTQILIATIKTNWWFIDVTNYFNGLVVHFIDKALNYCSVENSQEFASSENAFGKPWHGIGCGVPIGKSHPNFASVSTLYWYSTTDVMLSSKPY